VREFTPGPGVVLPDDAGLSLLVTDGAQRAPDTVVLCERTGEGWREVTYRRFADEVQAVAMALLADGVAHGDRIAIMGKTSYPWALVSFAAASVGAVVVPVYPTASAAQARHVVGNSGARWAFAETPEHAALLAEVGTWELGPRLLGELGPWAGLQTDSETDSASAAGEQPAPADEGLLAAFEERRRKVRADDLATIIYTSGTTGLPKGCMLTHRNMFASSANTVVQTGELFSRAGDGSQAATMLALPLSHVFGQTILIACVYAGTRTALLPGVPELVGEMAAFRPSFLALVPYALEKIRKRIAGADDATARAAFGGRLAHVISGGASLDDTTDAFFRRVGVDICNCYGLTEAATAVTVNAPATNRPGTVGRPIPGTTVGIADDGEVLVRGANVSPGYWTGGEPAGARDAAPSGPGPWLRTGDLGRLDDDGYLMITGRRKEILVTNSGKNVSPTLLEDRVRLHPLVSNCMVVGDGRPFVGALITLDETRLGAWAADAGVDLTAEGRRSDPALLAEVARAVEDANSLVSRPESIREFRVLPVDFTLEQGHLTPSMKLRRNVIADAFRDEISAIYP